MAFSGNFLCTSFKKELMEAKHNFTVASNVFKLALYTNSASFNAATTAYTSGNEISGTNYTAKGNYLTSVTPTIPSGTTAITDFADEVFSNVTISAVRGAMIFNEAATGDPSVCILDFGSDSLNNLTIRVVNMVVLVNRAKMSTSTTGTGTITLGSAVAGYQTFAAAGVSNSNTVRYVIEEGSNWEIGSGTYTSSGTTLSRTPSQSNNSGNAITLQGSAEVFISAGAEDIQPQDGIFVENGQTVSANYTLTTGKNAVSAGPITIASGVTVTVPSGAGWAVV